MKKAQSSFEYIGTLTILLLIIVPIVFVFYQRTTQVSDDVMQAQAKEAADKIIATAKDIYHATGQARRTIDINMPAGLVNISSENNDTILMYMENGQLHAFSCPVPINISITGDYVHSDRFMVEKKQEIIQVCAYGQCE